MIFLASVRYLKTLENGSQKRVTEVYAVDAFSPSDCEAKLTDEFSEQEFAVSAIRASKIADVVGDDGVYYDVKASFVTLDERTAAEKRTTLAYLVRAEDFDGARKVFGDFMKGVMADWELDAIVRSRVIEYFL